MTKPKIIFYLPSLVMGGAERTLLRLAEGFLLQGVAIELLLDQEKGELLTQVPVGLKVHILGAKRLLRALPLLTRWLARHHPDIILSAISHNNIIALLAKKLSGTDTKIIVSEHTILSSQTAMYAGWQHCIMPYLARLFYPMADAVITVSKMAEVDLQRLGVKHKDGIEVIENPVVTPDFWQRMEKKVAHPWFEHANWPVLLAIGRLVPLKGYETLLQAVAKVYASQNIRLIILGEGAERQHLEALRDRLGLAKVVHFLGVVDDPLPYLARAAVVVSASHYEGFGLVLVEALACGAKIVSTDCPGGARTILQDGRLGFLVPVGDASAMAAAIVQSLATPVDKTILQRRANDFSVERAVAAYDQIFARVLHRA